MFNIYIPEEGWDEIPEWIIYKTKEYPLNY
jgi:hypothetical protein